VIYSHQKQHSVVRGHDAPAYTKEELGVWLNTQPNFLTLHLAWVESTYAKHLKPSVDRLDDNLPYSFDNIQLITFGENNRKFALDVKSGKNVFTCREIEQLSMSGKVLNTYQSATHAQRETGIHNGGIGSCAKGNRPTAGGYIWRYTNVD